MPGISVEYYASISTHRRLIQLCRIITIYSKYIILYYYIILYIKVIILLVFWVQIDKPKQPKAVSESFQLAGLGANLRAGASTLLEYLYYLFLYHHQSLLNLLSLKQTLRDLEGFFHVYCSDSFRVAKYGVSMCR